jgi:hypothetical protein
MGAWELPVNLSSRSGAQPWGYCGPSKGFPALTMSAKRGGRDAPSNQACHGGPQFYGKTSTGSNNPRVLPHPQQPQIPELLMSDVVFGDCETVTVILVCNIHDLLCA